MVASTLKKDIDHHIAGVEGVRKRYPALRFLDELITKVPDTVAVRGGVNPSHYSPVYQEVADDGREKVRYKKESGTYCLLWLMRCIMFNVTLVDLVVDGKRRVSFLETKTKHRTTGIGELRLCWGQLMIVPPAAAALAHLRG